MNTLKITKTTDKTPNKPVERSLEYNRFRTKWFVSTIILASIIIASLFVLWFVRSNDYAIKHNQLVINAESTAENVRLQLNGNRDYLLLLSKMRSEGLLDAKSFQERVSQYVTENPELICVNWVNADYVITDAAPYAPNKQIVGLKLNLPEPQRASRLARKTRHPVYTHPFVVIQGELAFELWVPVFHADEFLGLFGGIYSYEKMLNSVVNPQVLSTNHITLLSDSGKALLDMPRRGKIDDRMVQSVLIIPLENRVSLLFHGYGPGIMDKIMLLIEIFLIVLSIGLVFTLWRLKLEIDEGKRAETTILQNRKMLERTERIAHVGSWEWDVANDSVTWSEELFNIFQLTPSAIAPSFAEHPKLYHPDDMVKLEQAVEAAVTIGTPYELELRAKRMDGETRVCLARGCAEMGSNGKAHHLYGSLQDITERKQAEEDLRKINRALRMLSDTNQALIRAEDETSLLNEVCRIAVEVGGYRIAWAGFVEHDEAKSVRPVAHAGLDAGYIKSAKLSWGDNERGQGPGGIAIRTQKPYIALDLISDPSFLLWREAAIERGYKSLIALPLICEGETIAVLGIYSADTDAFDEREVSILTEMAGDLGFGITTLRNIAKRILAEEALHEGEKELKEAQRIAKIGNWDWDALTDTIKWSEEYYHIFGFDPSKQPPGYKEHLKVYTTESATRLDTAVQKNIQTGEPYEIDLELANKDGQCNWITARSETKRDADGQIIGLRGTAQDITERKYAEDENIRIQAELNQVHKMEMLGQLAGGVAHDFNNLLIVIMGYSADLSSSPSLDCQSRHDAEEIFKAGTRAKGLSQQLLAFSRKQVIQAKVLDLNELITNLQSIFSRLLGEHIGITNIPSPEKAMVKADQGQLDQVVINLVLNSRDAMPLGGKIIIETSILDYATHDIESQFKAKPGKYVLLSVTDTGNGMPKSIQEKIFEPFFTTKDKGSGLGLGLSTVYGIVTQTGGSIIVDSEPGRGTTIKVLLPYTYESPVIEQEVLIGTDKHGKGEAILIVEDEESLAVYFRKMISNLGYKIAVANSGAEAICMLEKGLHPDLVMTDVIMPGMNGKELVDKIRLLVPEQKVLFMSGFTDNIIMPFGVLEEGIPFIQKPFTAHEIAVKIKTLLSAEPHTIGKSIKILMLDDEADILFLMNRTCKKIGHEFKGVVELDDALLELGKAHYDVLLIDINLIGITGMDALQRIRAAGHNIPVIAVSGALDSKHEKALQALGVQKILEKSFDMMLLINAAEEVVKS